MRKSTVKVRVHVTDFVIQLRARQLILRYLFLMWRITVLSITRAMLQIWLRMGLLGFWSGCKCFASWSLFVPATMQPFFFFLQAVLVWSYHQISFCHTLRGTVHLSNGYVRADEIGYLNVGCSQCNLIMRSPQIWKIESNENHVTVYFYFNVLVISNSTVVFYKAKIAPLINEKNNNNNKNNNLF